MTRFPLILAVLLAFAACSSPERPASSETQVRSTAVEDVAGGENHAQATFAGGCFWCMEGPFDVLPGVVSTTSGFTGGTTPNPSYRQVVAGGTGHAEAVRVVYDSTRISYAELLDVYWRNTDPLDGGGQFCDRGAAYRPAIFTHGPEQARLAEATRQQVAERFGQPVATEIEPAGAFYAAEEYHQGYYLKEPARYRAYRQSCGRDARLAELWGEG